MRPSSLVAFVSLLGSALSLPPAPDRHAQISTWRTLASIPLFPRQEHTTVFLPPSSIAILGGVVPNETLPVPIDTTALVQLYSIGYDTWTTGAPLPKPLNHLNAAVVDGSIYVLGGLAEEKSSSGRAWRADASSWVYSPLTNTWSSLPDVPPNQLRGSAAVGVHGSKIYLAGGVSVTKLSGDFLQTTVPMISIFDTSTKKWLEVPPAARNLPEPRDHAGAAVVNGKMYVLGGRIDGNNNPRGTVFVLDLCNVEAGWKTRTSKMPTARGGVCTGIVGNRILTFGGEGNTAAESGVFDQVEAYDTTQDSWDKVGTMSIPRHGTYAVSVRGKVYIPGGGIVQAAGPVADFDVFEP